MKQITIPSDLLQRIEKKIGSSDATEYIIDLIQKDLAAYSTLDEAKVKERLKSLGYLD